ncbi:MAG: DUF3793 family protein [Anaerococcus sp.]|nr:DUF3793 family protein [Anaerococcus sp.]
MPVGYLLDFYSKLDEFKDLDYLISILKFNLAPLIHKKKLGSLISLTNSRRRLKELWDRQKDKIMEILELSFYELKEEDDRVLIYFYREERLRKKLNEENIKLFLESYGYKDLSKPNEYFIILKERFSQSYPVEIGVFLGYPLEDIIFFRSSENYKCVGYWKCFNNEQRALRTFRKYDASKICEMKKILQAV